LSERQQSVAAAFAEIRQWREQLDRLRMDSRERAARLELVEFQLSELTKAALKPGEDDELAATRQVLRSADTIQRLCTESYRDLYEADGSVLSTLGHVWKRVGELAAIEPRFSTYLDQRDSIKSELEDLAFTLRDYVEGIDASPARLEQVEERLALLERLKRKHGPTVDEVIARRDALAAEHAALTGGGASSADIEAALQSASARFLGEARALSTERKTAARRFATALERELHGLAMERARFEVRLATRESESDWTEQGIDAGEFFLSANLGEDLRPLARIVSGGELSRVMLGLKTLSAVERPGQTLIFDEVDAGIGGRAATVVAEKLQALGRRFQVLCITHLPQIAASGTTQFLIEKRVQSQRTVTSVSRLDDEARVEEIARMIGGARVGPQARASARELLAAAHPPGAEAKGETRRERKRK
jgi:DNA repair protein RecN (Recombination protein N)